MHPGNHWRRCTAPSLHPVPHCTYSALHSGTTAPSATLHLQCTAPWQHCTTAPSATLHLQCTAPWHHCTTAPSATLHPGTTAQPQQIPKSHKIPRRHKVAFKLSPSQQCIVNCPLALCQLCQPPQKPQFATINVFEEMRSQQGAAASI